MRVNEISSKRRFSSMIASCGLLVAASGGAYGQVTVDIPGVNVKMNGASGNTAVSIGQGSNASNSAGSIEEGVEMEGVAVINGNVFIDGEKIPRGNTKHTAKKSGKSYRIQWGKNGNVSVEEN